MADLEMVEYTGMGQADFRKVPSPAVEEMVFQKQAIAVSPGNAFTATTHGAFDLVAGADCRVTFDGTTPTANSMLIQATERLSFVGKPGTVVTVTT